MRADRLLLILQHLGQRDRITARELAALVEVSERTIHRDMEALSASGIPVIADRGTGGGWYLHPGYKTSLTGLGREEIRTLLLPQLTARGADPAWMEAFSRASLKLLSALPPDWRKEAEDVRRRIHVDGAGWHGNTETPGSLRLLQEAIWAGRQIRMAYRKETGAAERIVSPLGLVIKGTIWYLVGLVDPDATASSAAEEETAGSANGPEASIRTYRVSRIESAQTLEAEAAEPPDGFDLAAYWAASVVRFKEQLPVYPAVLLADPTLLPRLQTTRFLKVEEYHHTEKGPIRVHVRFDTPESAVSIVLGFAGAAAVLEPDELRQLVRETAAGMAAAHSGPPPEGDEGETRACRS